MLRATLWMLPLENGEKTASRQSENAGERSHHANGNETMLKLTHCKLHHPTHFWLFTAVRSGQTVYHMQTCHPCPTTSTEGILNTSIYLFILQQYVEEDTVLWLSGIYIYISLYIYIYLAACVSSGNKSIIMWAVWTLVIVLMLFPSQQVVMEGEKKQLL